MRILITGGAGYIGSMLVEELLRKACHEVCVYDNLMYNQTSLLPFCHDTRFKFECGDVRDQERLKKFITPADIIFPLAAIVGAPACDHDPALAQGVNCDHVKFITHEATKNQIIIYPNSNSGYGLGQGDVHCTEESPLDPISHYGRTKCAAEQSVLDQGGTSLRLATVFGASYRQRLDLLVNDFVYRAKSDGFLVLFEKHFKRNYIHVKDVVGAFMFMMNQSITGRTVYGQAYNVGLSSANLSKHELALKIKEWLPDLVILCEEFKKDKDKRNYIVSNEKIEKLGWKPRYTLDDGIHELIQAYPMLFHSQQVHTNL
jgi:nucleoside-diphosphate-sugar epimerase